ncbi:MAG: flagellar biosynthetic protein FliQ [Planctomycetota bacterium]
MADMDIGIELIRQALMLTLICAAPILIAGLVVGVAVSLLQAVTQVQEQSLAFIPKIAAMFGAAIISLPWAGRQILQFAELTFGGGW